MQNMPVTLNKTFVSGWPAWCSIGRGTGIRGLRVDFTVRLAEHLKTEATKMETSADPATIIAKVRSESQRGGAAAFTEFWGNLEDALITLVYGSNFIETAGTSLGITTKLCREIFRGNDIDADIDERDPSYKEHLENLVSTHRKGDKFNVIHSRKEVINHARALNFLIDRVVWDNMPWSEELILQTHCILYEGIDEDVPAGEYRSDEVAITYSKPGEKRKVRKCMRAKAVPGYMRAMVAHLNNDITKAEASGELDPYTLAARYHHQLVMIHPFLDGNGRLSRILLNVLLLKYAGHLSTFGGEGRDKEEYLEVVGRAGKVFDKEDMEVEFDDMTSHLEFSKFVLTKSKKGLEKMMAWATGRAKGKAPM